MSSTLWRCGRVCLHLIHVICTLYTTHLKLNIEAVIKVKVCVSAIRRNKHFWIWKIHKIIISQCLGFGESAHLVFRAGNCSLLVDLPVYFITGSAFEAVHSVIMAAEWLPKVSEAADYRCQSQESKSESFSIRGFWLLEICHLPFYSPP